MLLIYLFVFFIVVSNTDIWNVLDFSKTAQHAYWVSIHQQLSPLNLASIVLVYLMTGGLLAFLSFILAFYLRLYQSNFRLIFDEYFDFLSFIPCIFWGFLYLYIVQPSNSEYAILNLLQFVLIIGVMIFPTLISRIFKSFNQISDDFIEMGYSLGANNFQIAYRLISPKLLVPIATAAIMIFNRLFTELAILSVIVGIWNFESVMWSVILIILLSAILVFILKRT